MLNTSVGRAREDEVEGVVSSLPVLVEGGWGLEEVGLLKLLIGSCWLDILDA